MARFLFNKGKLTPDDVLVLTMMSFSGAKAMGESIIHETAYILTGATEFKNINAKLSFAVGEDYVFSKSLHDAICLNTKRLSSSSEPMEGSSRDSYVMFSYEALNDATLPISERTYIEKHEREFSKNIVDYRPEVFQLTQEGVLIAQRLSREKLNKRQKRAWASALSELV